MSGRSITLFTMREFDFAEVAGSNGEMEIPIIKVLDVSGMTEGTLLVRVHSGNWSAGSGDKVEVFAYTTAPSAEDPSNDFWDTTAAGTVTLAASDVSAAPKLVTDALSANFGDKLRITVKGTQGSAQLNPMNLTLSAELVLKD